MKADKGAAASGFCPSPPQGFPSQSLQFTLKKKKKKRKGGKKHLRKVTDNYQNKTKNHTKSKPFSRLPSLLPPTQHSSLFAFVNILSATSPPGDRV